MSKIYHRFTQNLICEDALLSVKELAIKNKDSLMDANLMDADLRGANLRGAKILNKLIINYKDVSEVGFNRRQLRCFMLDDNSYYFMAGCFSGTEKELKLQVKKKYGDNCECMEAIKFLKKISKKY